ncbi:MAG: ABC transporter ATP-binding protein [Gemmatimonadota bacterium]
MTDLSGGPVPLILARGLTKRYGEHAILDSLDFAIEPGERIALLGLNGAGKTTLLRCLLGLTTYSGELTVAGVSPHGGGREARERIGFVPQRPPLFDLTLRAFIDLFAGLRGVPPEGPRRKLAEFGLPLDRTGDLRLCELSGGMLQKALLALALGAGGSVLLLDEPAANLDPTSRRELLRLLRKVDRDTTVVFATHRVGDVEALADRIIVLHDSRFAFDGTAARLWDEAEVVRRLWIRVPGREANAALEWLQGCEAVTEARRNGTGIEVNVRRKAQLDILCGLEAQGIAIEDFRTLTPGLGEILERISGTPAR